MNPISILQEHLTETVHGAVRIEIDGESRPGMPGSPTVKLKSYEDGKIGVACYKPWSKTNGVKGIDKKGERFEATDPELKTKVTAFVKEKFGL